MSTQLSTSRSSSTRSTASRFTVAILSVPLLGVAIEPKAQATYSAEPLGYPKRRAGLWEVRSTGAHALGMAATRYCIGEKTDQPETHLDRTAGQKGACTLGSFKRAGSSWVAETVCKEGKTSVVSKAIASGDFLTEYRIDTIVTYDPPLAGIRKEDKDAVQATYLGPCLSNHRAGDMVIPGMGTLNMHDGNFRPEPAPQPAGRRKSGT